MVQIRHVGIYVSNIEKMKSFYCKNFDLKVQLHTIERGSYINTILNTKEIEIELYKLKSSTDMILELLQIKNAEKRALEPDIYQTGCMHLAFTVPNVAWFFETLKKQDVKFLSAPCIAKDKKAKVCFCQDPEGNYLELVEELAEEKQTDAKGMR